MNPLAIFTGPYALLAKWGLIALLVVAFGGWSYTKGVSRESDRRDAIELQAVKKEQESHARMVAYGVGQARAAQLADKTAEDYRSKWKEARDAIKRKGTPLAVGDCNPVDAGAAAIPSATGGSGLVARRGAVNLRLTWEFVGLWDAVYTASDGKPVFGDTTGIEKGSAGPGAPSPYGPDEILDNHEANAARFDACRRQLRALNATIDGLQGKWDKEHGGN